MVISSKVQMTLFRIGAALLFFIGLTGILVVQITTGMRKLADGIICRLNSNSIVWRRSCQH